MSTDMQLARGGLEDPSRLVELEQQLEAQIAVLAAEAADAGYSMAEVLMASKVVCDRQHAALAEDPDPVNDPSEGGVMPLDIRDARFYVIDDDAGGTAQDAEPLEFDPAFQKACASEERSAGEGALH